MRPGAVPVRLRPARHVALVGDVAGGEQYLIGDGATHRVSDPAAAAALRLLALEGGATAEDVVARVVAQVAASSPDDVRLALDALLECGAVVTDLVEGGRALPTEIVGLVDAMRAHRGRPPLARAVTGAATRTRPAVPPRPREDADGPPQASGSSRSRSVRVRVHAADAQPSIEVGALTAALRGQLSANGFAVLGAREDAHEPDAEAPDAEGAPDLVVLACRDLTDPAVWATMRDVHDLGSAALVVALGAARVLLSPVLPAVSRPVPRPVPMPMPRAAARPGRSPDGAGPCADCLRHHLHRATAAGSGRVRRAPTPLASPALVAPVTGAVGAGLAVTLIVGWLATGEPAIPRREVLEWDARGPHLRRHPVVRRPQCATCGDPALVTRQTALPRPLGTASPGRRRGAAAFLRDLDHLLDPITGLVTAVEETARCGPFHTARATHAVLPAADGWHRATALGKGLSAQGALAGIVGEAVERCSVVWHGDETAVRATAAELGDVAVPPASVHLFSAAQQGGRSPVAGHDRAADPLPADLPVSWTPVWPLGGGAAPRWLPTASLLLGHPEAAWARPDSNGCAAGATWADAVLSGAVELVERDAVGIWWYARCRRPAVGQLGLEASAVLRRVARHLAGRGRQVWLLDLTTDVGVPVVAAVSALTEAVPQGGQAVCFGFGAHLDPDVAVVRALGELAQVLAVGPEAASPRHRIAQPSAEHFWRSAALADHPYLVPDPAASPAPARVAPTGDAAADALALAAALRRIGLDVLVADLTRPDLGVPVARVVVPGLRHFWPRSAPGRLYDVPVLLGWLAAAPAEADLNPVALFV
ncbi:MAG: TOMM precursor leader peptide-binding protein [Kineosporiaceae bacterium]